MEVLAEQAEIAILHGDYEAALETLAGIQFASCDIRCQRKILQLKALAQVQMAKTSGISWWAAFELDPPPLSSANDVKRAFKRLAALIHPDKCGMPDSGTAFTALKGGLMLLLNEMGSGDGSTSSHAKRRRPTAAGMETDEYYGQGFNWWDSWEGDDKDISPNTESIKTSEEDARQLADRSVEELDAEVRRRQQAMLSMRSDGKERPDLHALRDALNRARQALGTKLNSNRVNVAVEGGFFHQPNL